MQLPKTFTTSEALPHLPQAKPADSAGERYHTYHIKGFTLIELLVVVAVLGILSSVVTVAVNPTDLVPTSGGGINFGILIFFGTGLGLIGFGGWYFLLKKGKLKLPVKKEKGEVFVERDQKRKEDIERLQAMVEAYYKLNGVYPDPTQFEELKVDLKPEPKDPLGGQSVGETEEIFDYHYDNWSVKENKDTTSTYRLWAFLENENDPAAKDGKYLVTPETYGKELIPKMPETPEVPVETMVEEKPKEEIPEAQLRKPEVAAFAPSPQAIYLPAQDKITQILLVIFSLVVFIITIVNAYMVYKLNQLTAFLMQLLGKGL
ncbi:MAG: prepilin-type N-terminal cleavage/methylation domain-containing protein [Candidatus Cloacimonetes bacterium]|nr:prepilin-type N-terminal cleavage/methylation domain-containing protein [Candidatus Cloacimonadota bacterium]